MTLRQRFSNNRNALIGLGTGFAAYALIVRSAFSIVKPFEHIKCLESRLNNAREEVIAVNGGREPTSDSCFLLKDGDRRRRCLDAASELKSARLDLEYGKDWLNNNFIRDLVGFWAILHLTLGFFGNMFDRRCRQFRGNANNSKISGQEGTQKGDLS